MLRHGEKRHKELMGYSVWRGCKCYQMKQVRGEKWNPETPSKAYSKNMQTKDSEQCSLDTCIDISEVDLEVKSFNNMSLKCVNYNLIVF